MRGEGEGETLGGTINLGAANGELVFSLPPTIDSLPTERSLDLFILPSPPQTCSLEHLFETSPNMDASYTFSQI